MGFVLASISPFNGFCLLTSSHHLDQCGLPIMKALRHLPDNNLTRISQATTSLYNDFEYHIIKFIAITYGAKELTPRQIINNKAIYFVSFLCIVKCQIYCSRCPEVQPWMGCTWVQPWMSSISFHLASLHPSFTFLINLWIMHSFLGYSVIFVLRKLLTSA